MCFNSNTTQLRAEGRLQWGDNMKPALATYLKRGCDGALLVWGCARVMNEMMQRRKGTLIARGNDDDGGVGVRRGRIFFNLFILDVGGGWGGIEG
jgi:hypothetical protein